MSARVTATVDMVVLTMISAISGSDSTKDLSSIYASCERIGSLKFVSLVYSRPYEPGREHSWRSPLIPYVSQCAICRADADGVRSRSCKLRKSEEQSPKGKHGLGLEYFFLCISRGEILSVAIFPAQSSR